MPYRRYAVAALIVLLTLALLPSPALPVPALFNDGISSATGQDIYYAWVEFSDKAVRSEEHFQELLAEVEKNFNHRAMERRKKRRTLPGLFDARDLPVVESYLEGVAGTGAELMAVSRWQIGSPDQTAWSRPAARCRFYRCRYRDILTGSLYRL